MTEDASDDAPNGPNGPDEASRRRESGRASVVLQLEYRNAGHLLVSYCTNLSRGGLFIPSEQPEPAGTRLTLRLDVPGKAEPVSIEAEVRWVRAFDTDEGPTGMGLAFAAVDAILGDETDGIVAGFAPLRVELIGDRPAAWTHVAGQ
ncbi:MAG: TIGR02266 family protein, partial [Nannocystaceae bacterium]|nr:TIGR02266 family protein [Nannocystaceae bacterium]